MRKISALNVQCDGLGHTSATQIAMAFIRDHNRGKDAAKVPASVIRELAKCDGPYGPTEVRIEASGNETEHVAILGLDGAVIIFYAHNEPNEKTGAYEWTVEISR